MGLLDKAQPRVKEEGLTQKEIEFLLTKLRTADYKGTEFEMFFTVFKKLSDGLDKLKR